MISHYITKRLKAEEYRFVFQKDPNLIGNITIAFQGLFFPKYYINLQLEANHGFIMVDVPKSVYRWTRRFEWTGQVHQLSGLKKEVFSFQPKLGKFQKTAKFEDLT